MNDNNKNITLGFSTVELIVAVMITAIVMAVIGPFIVAHVKSFQAGKDIIALQREGQLAMNQIAEIVVESSKVDISTDVYKIARGGETYTITYYPSESIIRGQVGSDSEYEIARHIESFEISVDAAKPNLYKIKMSLKRDEAKLELEENIKARNSRE